MPYLICKKELETKQLETTDTPIRQQKRSIPFLVVVGLFGTGLAFLISTLDPFIYNEKVRVLAPPGFKNTTLGVITILTLVMAFIAQPLIGHWSDHTHSRWGKRAPYLTAGVIGVSLALVFVVTANSLWMLVLAAMLVSTFSNTTQAAWQALIPDQVPTFQHGTAAGIKTVLELTGVVGGVALVGVMLSRGNLWGPPIITITLFGAILLITLYTLHRASTAPKSTGQVATAGAFSMLLTALWQAPTAFYWWMANRFFFWSSAISIRTFLLNYLEDVLQFSPARAQELSSQLFVLLGVGVFLLALPTGAITDRVGRRPMLVVAGLMAAVGASIFIVGRNLSVLFVAGGLIAIGAGIFATTSWALATDLAPQSKGALYLALANGATVLGSIGGRLGGPLIDALNQLFNTVALGYMVVFAIAALFFVGSSTVVLKIPEKAQHKPLG